MATMNPSSDKKPEYLFANCTQCEGIIRIPITVRPDSTLVCPHCNDQVKLDIVLAQQVPEVKYADGTPPSATESSSDSDELESIQIETEGATAQQDGKFVVPPQLAAGIKKRRRRKRSSESRSKSRESSKSDGKLSEAEEIRRARRDEHQKREREKKKLEIERANAPIAVPRPTSRKSSSRHNTPKRSPVVEALKVIAGGLLAIPIAYLLLMWVFSRDPLGLAPSIHSAAPYLVPDAMIAVEEESGISSTPDASIDAEEPQVDFEFNDE